MGSEKHCRKGQQRVHVQEILGHMNLSCGEQRTKEGRRGGTIKMKRMITMVTRVIDGTQGGIRWGG